MFSVKKLMFVPVAFVLALLPCESRGQQTGTFSNLNLKKTGSAAGAYAFQFSGSSGILKAHNAAGAETSSWNPETGHFSGTVDLDLSECFILSEDNTVTGNNDFQGENRFANSIELYDSGASPHIDFDGATLTYDGSVENFAFSKNVNAPTFSGSGANLTNLNANNISAGTVPDARLSSNVARRDESNTFTGSMTVDPGISGFIEFNGIPTIKDDVSPGIQFHSPVDETFGSIVFNSTTEQIQITANGGITAYSLEGSGSDITNLNGSNIASGTIPNARLHSDVVLKNAQNALSNPFNTFTGTYTGNGAALNSLNASSLASGTVPDARLSANVPLKNAANTFTGQVTFNGGVVANVRALSGAGTHNILNTDYHLFIDVGAGNVTYNLPAATLGKSFIFITSNNGGSNTITFKAVTGENINTPTTFDNTWVSTPGSPSKRVYYVTCFFPGQWMITSYQPLTT